MIAFLCATPYQAFNAVQIKRSLYPSERADLYLLTYTSDLSGLCAPLERSGLFQQVYLVHTFDGSGSAGKMVGHLCFLQKDLRRFVRLTGGRDYYSEIQSLLVYQPQAMVENRTFLVRRIPPVSPQDAPVYNRIFGYGEEGAFYQDRPVLFLDQAFQKQLNLPVPTGKLLERVAAACGPQNVALRLHPTRPPEDGEYRGCDVAVAPASPCPGEVLLLNLDLEDRIFVSVHSTACLTPKLVFDQEPTVILLYRLVEELFERLPPHLRPNEAFFQAVRDTYRRPERFLIPSSIQELEDYLQSRKEWRR